MTSDPNIVNLNRLRRVGKSYAPAELYWPGDTGDAHPEQIELLVRNRRPLERGKTLFRQGDVAPSIYVVSSGSLRTFVEDRAGSMQVVGFHLPGEVLGMGGLGHKHYIGTAVALERSIVCEILYTRLQPLLSEMPALHQQLARFLHRRAELDQGHLVMMGKLLAQERLALFLHGLADRYSRLSRDPTELFLPMSRNDIASYLGLAMETVSRQFGRMETAGILTVDRKKVRILRPDLLAEICGDAPFAMRRNAAG